MPSEASSDPKADLERRKLELLKSIDDPALVELFNQVSESVAARPLVPAAVPEPQGPPPLPATEAAICAAIAHTFTMAADGKSGEPSVGEMGDIRPANGEERSVILANATPIMIAGQRRLQLSDEARGDFLTRVHKTEIFQSVLSRATTVDRDLQEFVTIGKSEIRLPGAWLRSFIEGRSGDVFKAPAREVRAAVDALTRLQFAGQGVVKTQLALVDARRALELSELLEPLRILTGSRGGWDDDPVVDRFAGRVEELKRLRGFVDELASKTFLEALSRGVGRFVKGVQYYLNISDESVFFIIARGGIGKTTLISKFVLDHALNQLRPFPFVYLDFDRATLHTRDPRRLLLEAARQVALQFPEIGPDVADLTNGLRQEIANGDAQSIASFDRFRGLLQSLTQGSRAFLVVFDTMEVVQYDPRSLAAVVNFVTYLNGIENPLGFPELKIVAAGRADVPELRTEQAQRSDKNRLVLPALSVTDAALMADGVGRDFLGPDWKPHWAELVAGKPTDPPERREPLVIRVAVELIRASPPEKRERLVTSIAQDGENATEDFVGLLYERRILEHVQDPEVRDLAWPGLVVRRVTRDIIATTLAPICGLDPTHVDHVFSALANEVWMVEEEENGEVLRHRPDLRSRTLPLMRRRKPTGRFEEVNAAAERYYASRLSTSKNRAEWLYHRLLGGENPDSVDRDWTDEMATLLAGAADDFAPESEVRAYLLGRTARTLLPPESIRKLSPRLALDHIARAGAQLGYFDDSRIEPIVLDLSERIASPEVASTLPHPAKAVILTKTGQWDAFASFEGGRSEWHEHSEFASRFKRARKSSARSPEFDLSGNKFPVRILIQDLAAARVMRLPVENEIDEAVAARLEQPLPNPGPTDIAALRTAVVFGWRSSRPAAQAWFRMQEMPGASKAVGLAELSALLDVNRSERRAMRSMLEPLLAQFKLNWNDLTARIRTRTSKPFRIGYPPIRRAILDHARRLLDNDHADNMHVLRRFFAARHEDWIVPFGYAGARVLGPSFNISDLYERAAHESNSLVAPEPGFRRPEDALQLFRWADETSDIDGVASMVLDAATGPQAADLRSLQVHYKAWREKIDALLDRNEAEGADDPPPADPIVNRDDPQKGRWGGMSERNGRRLEAKIGEIERETFDVDLTVSSTDDSTLQGPVLFHLHDSFPRSTIYIRRVRGGSLAVLEEVNCSGTFTVGAQVKAEDGRWTGLELDLAQLKEIPRRFIGR